MLSPVRFQQLTAFSRGYWYCLYLIIVFLARFQLSLVTVLILKYLCSNRLTGGLPVDLSRLSHLKELDLGNNNFSSQIPEEISQCTMLTSLLFNENRLSGSIPNSISKLSNLTRLDLSANNLTGVIPESYLYCWISYF
ncbi:hypothetical protein IFM89_006359 [Coptis chinensis]|uniref:Uncharacterized protein n=1 Tax=Coptis chinensis TaxID=261450 RepID=A0A835HTX4_9MAGN|nr:hypothetical protein IFM89_006359 [Coptis chinensis]